LDLLIGYWRETISADTYMKAYSLTYLLFVNASLSVVRVAKTDEKLN